MPGLPMCCILLYSAPGLHGCVALSRGQSYRVVEETDDPYRERARARLIAECRNYSAFAGSLSAIVIVG